MWAAAVVARIEDGNLVVSGGNDRRLDKNA
jgi:hypothetical protein